MRSARRTTGEMVDRWTAIGCLVHVETRTLADQRRARGAVTRIIRDIDEVASRFRDDSDLTRVNRSAGSWVRVDPLLVHVVEVALTSAADTQGLVNPLLGRRLVELGYDRTFEALRPTASVVPTSTPAVVDAWREVVLSDDAIKIPAGTALDLGATAKAWCVDLAVAALRDRLDAPALISVGGDLRTIGGATWRVGVGEHPDDPADEFIALEGALATSSSQVRRWSAGGVVRHHLLDPRTGEPTDGPWRTVSVAAGTCVDANTASTLAIVLGAEAPPALVDRGITAARLVDGRGTITTVGSWPTDHQEGRAS